MSNKLNLTEDLKRYNEINKYVTLLNEQAPPTTDPTAAPADPTAVPAPTEEPAPEATTPEIPAPDGGEAPIPEEPSSDDSTEELDITDLVNMTKSIKKDLETKGDNSQTNQKMDDIFSKLTDLEQKLQSMNDLVTKIDNLSVEIQQVKPKTPEEKLEMRSLDSYPFNKNPQEFFNDKQEEMRASGKNEYVLRKDDIENYGQNEILKTFNPEDEDEDTYRY